MKAWLKGGLIGAIIFLVLIISWWIYISILMNCLLDPSQLVNVGGADCDTREDIIPTLIVFGIPIIFGFLIGALIGWIIGKIKSKK
jgi:ABC-type nitrate/sulfonate/bicarbonate transport system permease component